MQPILPFPLLGHGGNPLTEADERAKLARAVEVAGAVWGRVDVGRKVCVIAIGPQCGFASTVAGMWSPRLDAVSRDELI